MADTKAQAVREIERWADVDFLFRAARHGYPVQRHLDAVLSCHSSADLGQRQPTNSCCAQTEDCHVTDSAESLLREVMEQYTEGDPCPFCADYIGEDAHATPTCLYIRMALPGNSGLREFDNVATRHMWSSFRFHEKRGP